MLRFLNGLLVIGTVGLLMAVIFLVGQASAHNQDAISALVDRWYLIAAFMGALVAAWVTGRTGKHGS